MRPPAELRGDYVHCNSRIVNILLKRLLGEFDDPRKSAPLRALIGQLTSEVRSLPLNEQLAPRPTKAGTLDLTASTLLVQNKDMHAEIGKFAKVMDKKFPLGTGHINLGSAVHALLTSLSSIHSLWRKKTPLTNQDKVNYRSLCKRFGDLWAALHWKVSLWVHWLVCHSPALADLHGNFYVFSSIPIERRNVDFKMDVRHCFLGGTNFLGPMHAC